MSVFFVGDSHLGAVVNAYHLLVERGRAAGVPTFVWLSQFQRHLQPARGAEGLVARLLRPARAREDAAPLDPVLRKVVARAAGAADLMVLAIAGNDHNVIGLLNHERRFDFVLPTAPELPLLEGHEVVPVGLIEAALSSRVEYPLKLVGALAGAVKCRVVHLQSPPPIPSADHIARNPDQMFRGHVERLGVAPASLRFKLWKLHSAIWQKACDGLGVPVLPPPPEAVDAAGFLAERAWGKDGTHANEWYGELVIAQVEALARTAVER